MTPRERRTFVLAAALLLAASLLRWGLGEGREAPLLPPDSAGIRDQLLAATKKAVSEEERRARPLARGERIDPNRASAVELDRLPGVGPSTADAIVEARAAGGFQGPEALERVRGIGPASVARMKPFLDFSRPPPVTVVGGGAGAGPGSAPLPPGFRSVLEPATAAGAAPDGAGGPRGSGRRPATEATGPASAPVLDLNHATEAQLEGLSGVGPALAARILALRRKKGRFRRVEELLEVRGIGPATLERLKGRLRAGP